MARLTHFILRVLLTITVLNLVLWTGARYGAHAEDQTAVQSLVLADLIKEAMARNPELTAARQQWEGSSKRIVQARALDDPTLSVHWWNFPQSFNLGRADNTIIGLSQKFPFPGKLALRAEIASRSSGITEQALRVKERDLTARIKGGVLRSVPGPQGHPDPPRTDRVAQTVR